eukprot:Pgem_evm1s2550
MAEKISSIISAKAIKSDQIIIGGDWNSDSGSGYAQELSKIYPKVGEPASNNHNFILSNMH